MKTTRILLISLILVLFAGYGCGPADKKAEEGEGDAADTVATEQPMQQEMAEEEMPMQGMYVIHEVASYDDWKPVFDEHESDRQEAGMQVHFVARDDANPNVVHIAGGAQDLDKVRAFAASEDLKSAMEESGVSGKPNIRFYKMESFNPPKDPSQQMTRLAVSHEVGDYDSWKEVYDNNKGARDDAGLSEVALARDADNPNRVMIMFTYADKAKAEEFVNSEDLKSAMDKAGVVGPPEMHFITITDMRLGQDED